MAYAAVNCLAQTIYRLLNSSHISTIDSFPEISVFEHDELEDILDDLRWSDRRAIRSERLNTLDGEIREAAYKLEDAIETLVSNQFLSHQSQDAPPFSLSIDLEELKQHFDSFKQTVKKMKAEYVAEVRLLQKINTDAADPSTSESEENKSKMVGLSHHLSAIKWQLIQEHLPNTVSISGMAGIGKTTIAREIFEDPEIEDCFDDGAWVRVGREYQLKEIVCRIVSQFNPDADKKFKMEFEFEDYLRSILRYRRCLIVLDDVWDKQLCTDLERFLPRDLYGSRFLVTSTLDNVAGLLGRFKTPFLNKEESWLLLREKVFGDQQELSCPRELEKAGKKIAEKCDGLPLLIVTVGNILSKAKKTPKYWNQVAERKNSVFTDAYNQVSNALLPSYNYLTQELKTCFLYMGILPQDSEISRSKLVNLWEAEGFLGPNNEQSFERFATECLEELVSRNVVVLRQKVSAMPSTGYYTEKYHLHSTFLHLCVREAGKNKFHQVLNRYTKDAIESMEGQRRLCIQNNVLFSIEDMYYSMSSISAARSLLCTGPHHPYPVPMCFGLRLLRVLDSLTIRFYEFPIEVLELIQLRYFAMTYDGDLPALISKLLNLECLIVGRHIHLKSSSGAPSYLPMEIWDMKELKHLQVTGSDLPNPRETSILPNLLTLLDVSIHSCTQRVLERIPKLHRLGIRTELHIGAAEPMIYFDHIPTLPELEALTIIANSIVMPEVVAPTPPPPPPPSIISSNMKKLSLDGLGYPWEHIKMIASLPNLRELKLRCNACRGPKWESPLQGFRSLAYLLIEDCDLAVWTRGRGAMPYLGRLSLKHCYQLEVIPELSADLTKIEVIDCNPSAVRWAEKQKSYVRDVYVDSSWQR